MTPCYRIPCVWQMAGEMFVHAESEQEAIERAYANEPLPRGGYIEGSFEVDRDVPIDIVQEIPWKDQTK